MSAHMEPSEVGDAELDRRVGRELRGHYLRCEKAPHRCTVCQFYERMRDEIVANAGVD